jgi:hypothetical protein
LLFGSLGAFRCRKVEEGEEVWDGGVLAEERGWAGRSCSSSSGLGRGGLLVVVLRGVLLGRVGEGRRGRFGEGGKGGGEGWIGCRVEVEVELHGERGEEGEGGT